MWRSFILSFLPSFLDRVRRHPRDHTHSDRTSCFQFLFACPIFRCPAGMTFAVSQEGCQECRCIPIGKPKKKRLSYR